MSMMPNQDPKNLRMKRLRSKITNLDVYMHKLDREIAILRQELMVIELGLQTEQEYTTNFFPINPKNKN